MNKIYNVVWNEPCIGIKKATTLKECLQPDRRVTI